MIRVLDLFSGIGGFSLGLERTGGFRTVGFCERDPFCQQVLAKHWPDVWQHDDVRTLTTDLVHEHCGPIDMITGGVPCQPASVAGKRRGSADERWMWPAFLRVVREVRPVWVLAENVLGLIGLRPHGLDWICDQLEDDGYECLPVLCGADHAGAPHHRARVWLVVHANRPGLPGPERSRVHFEENRGRGGHCESVRPMPFAWPPRPGEVGRIPPPADGISGRLARHRRPKVKALGNAVVPQVVEMIGRAILESE